jgi:hypothetical protein
MRSCISLSSSACIGLTVGETDECTGLLGHAVNISILSFISVSLPRVSGSAFMAGC